MAKSDKNYLQPEFGTSEHLKGSRHSGVSAYRKNVRIRHPEIVDDVVETRGGGGWGVDPFLTLDSPEDGLVSLDQPCNPFADTTCYLLDDFARTYTTGTYSAGDAWTAAVQWEARERHDTPFYMVVDTPVYNHSIDSSLGGGGAIPYTENPGWGCEGKDFTFWGWFEQSNWFQYTVPAHPGSMAGIVLGAVTFSGHGLGANVMVSTSAPTSIRDGTIVGHCPSGVSTTVFVPGALIPAEGQDLWVGYVPAWQADLGAILCGFTWPWMGGDPNSAKGVLSPISESATWQTWDSGTDDWGGALGDGVSGAWWEGNLPWSVGFTGGSLGLDGDNLYLTVAAGSQEILTATMVGASLYNPDDSNDDPLGEPWTDELGVRMKVRFKLTTAGDVTEAGSRYISFSWHTGREVHEGTVWLGDLTHAQGLSVISEGTAVETTKDITEDSWMWFSLDARNPEYLRARMWAEAGAYGSGEPAVYDAQVAVGDDTESASTGNYFKVVISAGNQTGADQTVEIDAIWFCGAGEDCEWVEERIGQGDGVTNVYATTQPYKPSSLWFFVDGHHVRTLPIDVNRGTFMAVDGVAADNNAVMVARYRADLNPSGD